MPKVSIEARGGWMNILEEHQLPLGLLADTPDEDGTYPTVIPDKTITIEMHPPEAPGPSPIAVALSCGVFVGHTRSKGYEGKERHVVYINGKKGKGSTGLSAYDKVVVELHKP